MKVNGVLLNGFTKHEQTELRLPERGVVLVTGPNGSGKSSIVEAVAWTVWGETLRGSRPTDAGGAAIITDKGKVARERKKDKVKVEYDRAEKADTATKAQEALDAAFGSFDVWRRSHVFSSSDAAHFTMATDSERKRYLESVLGLERFDRALEACRAELKRAEAKLANAEARLLRAKGEKDGCERRVADAQRTWDSLPPPAPPAAPADVEAQKSAVILTEEGIRRLQAEAQQLGAQGATERMKVKAAEGRLARLAKPGAKCGECGQLLPVDAAAREALEKEVQQLKEEATRAKEAVADRLKEVEEQLEEDQETLRALRSKVQAASSAASVAQATARTRSQAEKTLKSAQEALQAATGALKEAEDAVPPERREVAVLTAAEAVLGLKGVRAGILTRLLSGLEAAANAWLPKLAGPGLKLELKPYSEKKSGGVADAISVQVHGAGGGYGYKAASSGERRRIDLALLLAFAGDGTLFLDECLDALDTAGVEAAIELLEHLSKERSVVLITHNEDLAARVPHAVRWRVEGGRVS